MFSSPTSGPGFPDALRRASEIAALSPSSHNSQPWGLAWLASAHARRSAAALFGRDGRGEDGCGGNGGGGDGRSGGGLSGHGRDGRDGDGHGEREYLALALDGGRRLDSLPAHTIEMWLSCGMYWQLLLRGLAAQGWTLRGLRFCAGGPDGTVNGNLGSGVDGNLGSGLDGNLGSGVDGNLGSGVDGGLDGFLTGNPGGHLNGRLTGGLDGDRRGDGTAGDEGWPSRWSPLCVAELCRGDAVGDLAEFRATAGARRTNRGPYREDPIEPAILSDLTAPSGAAADGAEVDIRHLSGGDERAGFARLVARYGGRDFAHDRAWRETHSFIRWSDAEAGARGDGFTLRHLFGPLPWSRRLLMRAALDPATMRVLRHVGYHRVLAGRLAAIVRPTPVIVAMSLSGDSVTAGDAVRAGARLADYWLRVTRAGLALHPISVVLQHDDARRALQKRFGLRGRAFFVSRLGRPTGDVPASPRRTPGLHLI